MIAFTTYMRDPAKFDTAFMTTLRFSHRRLAASVPMPSALKISRRSWSRFVPSCSTGGVSSSARISYISPTVKASSSGSGGTACDMS
jgi:hypothetical protein